LVKITTGNNNKKMRRAVGMFKMVTSRLSRVLTPKQYETIKITTYRLPNSMSNPGTKSKHLNSIAIKIGYQSHEEYLSTVVTTFEEQKTIKGTSIKLGHAQHIILRLLLKYKGKEWLESIRKEGLKEARSRQIEKMRSKPKKDQTGDKNYNAYVWKAISPDGNIFILRGNRLQFCKDQGIGTSLDPCKPHLRGYWEFKKLCKIKDYDG
jgi:hypothetical protein